MKIKNIISLLGLSLLPTVGLMGNKPCSTPTLDTNPKAVTVQNPNLATALNDDAILNNLIEKIQAQAINYERKTIDYEKIIPLMALNKACQNECKNFIWTLIHEHDFSFLIKIPRDMTSEQLQNLKAFVRQIKKQYTRIAAQTSEQSQEKYIHIAVQISEQTQKEYNLVAYTPTFSLHFNAPTNETFEGLLGLFENAPTNETFEGALGLLKNDVRCIIVSEGEKVTDIQSIASFKSLQRLELRGCKDLENIDIDFLGEFTQLEHLVLGKCQEIKIDFLKKLANLQSLELEWCVSVDCTPIGSLEKLQSLFLNVSSVENIHFLRPLKKLRCLNLRQCGCLYDIEAIQYLPSLQHLEITTCCVLRDYIPIMSLKNLQHLSIGWGDKLENIDFLSPLENLQSLYLQGHFTDITPVGRLTNLQSLDLDGCFTDITPVRRLTKLKSLSLRGDRIL